jgi:hypothetical protein
MAQHVPKIRIQPSIPTSLIQTSRKFGVENTSSEDRCSSTLIKSDNTKAVENTTYDYTSHSTRLGTI